MLRQVKAHPDEHASEVACAAMHGCLTLKQPRLFGARLHIHWSAFEDRERRDAQGEMK